MEKNYLAPVVFHYTGEASARKIVESGEFRLSSKTNLNDDQQISARINRAYEIAVEKFGEEKVGRGFLEFMHSWVPPSYYIGCFTESPRNREMWSTYAKNGGVCLAFYTEGFKPHIRTDLSLHLVNYPNANAWDQKIRGCFDALAAYWGNEDDPELFKAELARIFIECVTTKHELFGYEKETRLIYGSTMHKTSKIVDIRGEYAFLKLPAGCLTRIFLDTIYSIEAAKFIAFSDLNSART